MDPSKITKVCATIPTVSFDDIEPEVWFDFLAVELPKIDYICQERKFAYACLILQKTVRDTWFPEICQCELSAQPWENLRIFLQEFYGSYPPCPLPAELHTDTDSVPADLHPNTDSVPADLQTNTDSVSAELHTDTVKRVTLYLLRVNW